MDKNEFFNKLPYWLKVAAASLRGFYLRWWRYGPDTNKLVSEILERDTWSLERLQAHQNEELARLLDHTATRIPYYREQWTQRRKKGDRSPWDVLGNWPVLRKEEIRQNPKAFVDPNAHCLFIEHTSGSTGTPLTLYHSRETLHSWYALHAARVLQWNGVSLNNKWGIIGGQMIVPFSQHKPPFWVWNHALHQLYLSSYHISQRNVTAYVEAIEHHKIDYLLGYPSSLTALSNFAQELKLKIPPMKVIISNAEPLFDYQRESISKAFCCPVVDTYGMSELVCGASECGKGSLHLWPEAGFVQILNDTDDTILPPQTTGRIICTGLLNFDMPLIRYETGDRGSLNSQPCACGRTLPIIEAIDGRMDDIIVTADGRRLGRLDPIFKTDIPIREAQIIQEDIETIRVKFVPDTGYDHDKLLSDRLHERLGDMELIFEQVESIPRGANGKFRAVISRIQN